MNFRAIDATYRSAVSTVHYHCDSKLCWRRRVNSLTIRDRTRAQISKNNLLKSNAQLTTRSRKRQPLSLVLIIPQHPPLLPETVEILQYMLEQTRLKRTHVLKVLSQYIVPSKSYGLKLAILLSLAELKQSTKYLP